VRARERETELGEEEKEKERQPRVSHEGDSMNTLVRKYLGIFIFII
jgi:hypothetical protein